MATLSQAGYELIKGFEGLRLKPYHLNGERYYTVGLGHNGPDVIPGRIYTEAECMALFSVDKLRFENNVNKVWHTPMTQQMFDALFSLAYNCGHVSGTVISAACAGNGWQNQAKLTRIWINYKNNKGVLRRRRQAEIAYFYGMADTGGAFPSGSATAGSFYPSTSPYNNYSGGTGAGSGGYPPNNYETFNSIYAGAELNTNKTASTVFNTVDSSTEKHTRIYKYSNPTVVIDELSMTYDKETINSSTKK